MNMNVTILFPPLFKDGDLLVLSKVRLFFSYQITIAHIHFVPIEYLTAECSWI